MEINSSNDDLSRNTNQISIFRLWVTRQQYYKLISNCFLSDQAHVDDLYQKILLPHFTPPLKCRERKGRGRERESDPPSKIWNSWRGVCFQRLNQGLSQSFSTVSWDLYVKRLTTEGVLVSAALKLNLRAFEGPLVNSKSPLRVGDSGDWVVANELFFTYLAA